MMVTTASDQTWGFSVQFDDHVALRNARIPDKIALQLPSSNICFISKEPLDFFSRRRYILSDANQDPIAVLSGRIGWAALKVRDTIHRVRMRAIFGLPIAIGRQSYAVESLGIEFEIREHFFSSKVVSKTDAIEDQTLALITLLHFAWIHKWREA